MSAPLSYLAENNIGIVIWCKNTCPRFKVYVPPDEALKRFGAITCEEAQRKVRCEACGEHGRDGRIQILPSTLDMDDRRNGRAPGTSEREAADR